MKPMKKNDGYVVVYVLIVFTILSLVAVSICSVALKNLKAQRASVDRMEVRYEAEGFLQEFVAETGTISSGESWLGSLTGESGVQETVEDELGWAITDTFPVKAEVSAWNVDDEGNSNEPCVGDNWIDVTVTAQDKKELPTVQINAVLKVPVAVIMHPGERKEPDNPENLECYPDTYTYEVSGPIQYESYTISYEGGGA